MADFIQSGFSVDTQVGILSQPPTDAENNIVEYREFYDGFQDVRLTARQKLYLKCSGVQPNAFANVSKMVTNVVLDRLAIEPDGGGIIARDGESQDYADLASEWWTERGLDKFSADLHKMILRDGSAALFVEWIDGAPIFTPKPIYSDRFTEGIRFHSETNAIDIHFDFASYQWPVMEYSNNGEVVGSTRMRLNLYTKPEAEGGSLIHRFVSEGDNSWRPLDENEIENEIGIRVSNPQELPISRIPIIKFVNSDQLSEIADIFRLQQLVNKTVGDIDIATDYHAFPLLAADDFTKASDQEIEPGSLIKATNARRIEPANTEMMWDGSVLKYIDMISLVKRWPIWLLNPREFTVPSGTALRVAERPLVAQIREKQNSLGPQWRLAFDVALEWYNSETKASITGDIRIKWQSAATDNVIEDNEIIVRTAKQAGLPDETIWEQTLGLTTSQIDEIKNKMIDDPDHKEQQATIIQILSQALVDIQQAALFAGVEEKEAAALAEFGNAEGENDRTNTSNSNTGSATNRLGAGSSSPIVIDGGGGQATGEAADAS